MEYSATPMIWENMVQSNYPFPYLNSLEVVGSPFLCQTASDLQQQLKKKGINFTELKDDEPEIS